MAALTEGNVVYGAAAIIRVNGIAVGDASGITIQVSAQNAKVRVMGNPFAKEIVTTNVDVSVSVNKFMIYRDSSIVQGLFPESTPSAIWSSPYLDIEIVDADDGSPAFGALRLKPASLNVAVDQAGIAGENQTFDGTYYKDHRPLSVAA